MAQVEGKVVTVEIVGQKINLRYQGSEEKQSILEVAKFVNQKVAALKERHFGVATLNLMTLACLNVGKDFLDYKKKFDGQSSDVRHNVEILIDKVDESIAALTS